jgi:glycosyltransferase involved in cell wall biosynthesis
MNRVLRICIDARLIDGMYAGVQNFITGLAYGLSKLRDGDEEYLFLTYAGIDSWLRPFIGGRCKILPGPTAPEPQAGWKRASKFVFPAAYRIWRELKRVTDDKNITIPKSDGIVERAGVDLMHFTTQSGFLTDIPSIYHPWDLQHLHLPQLFSSRDHLIREVQYRAFCEQARMVATASSWTKMDLIQNYDLAKDKVRVIPLAPILAVHPKPSDEEITAVRNKYSLAPAFIFYPAQTYAHKNHMGLLEALAILRDRYGLSIPCISSGRLTDFFPNIRERIQELQLFDQVQFLGFVSPLELSCLYKLCLFLVFPTRFEGWGMPLMEAFVAGVPVACSNVTCLPDQVGNAALLFNPSKPGEIADAIYRLWIDASLRSVLLERGKQRVLIFTWEKTAKMFRAHYRRIAGRRLTEEDCALLDAPPIL